MAAPASDISDSELEGTPLDETAQRLLNLLFVFNAASRPLTTDEVVSDSDLGYGSPNRASDLRKFRRDREKLAERGVFITEVHPVGSSEAEQSSWAIDRERTFAGGGIADVDDIRQLVDAVDAYLARPDSPLAPPLTAVRNRALEALASLEGELPVEEGGEPGTAATPDPVTDALWTAFSLRRSLPISYRNAGGEASRRTVAIFGVFSHAGAGYIVARDDASGSVRTFRIDRIHRVGALRGAYEIPSDFDIRPYLFLPFDLSAGQTVEARFTLPAERTPDELDALTLGRGTTERADDGTWIWTVGVRDLDAGAAYALEHARDGMRPAGPEALVSSWRTRIRKAVAAHGA